MDRTQEGTIKSNHLNGSEIQNSLPFIRKQYIIKKEKKNLFLPCTPCIVNSLIEKENQNKQIGVSKNIWTKTNINTFRERA